MDVDSLDAEFGASPLGKSGSDARPAAAAAQHEPSGPAPKALDFDEGGVPEAAAPLDLYGDLYGEGGGEGGVLLKTQLAQLKNQCATQEKLMEELKAQLETLQAENTELQGANATLSTNISSLFNTAKLEIERKDAEIKELRGRVAAAAAAAAGPGGDRHPGGERRAGSRGRERSTDDRRRGGDSRRDSRDGRSGGGRPDDRSRDREGDLRRGR